MEISWIYSRVNVPGFVPKKRSNLEKFSFIIFQNSEQNLIQFFFTRNYSLQELQCNLCNYAFYVDNVGSQSYTK